MSRNFAPLYFVSKQRKFLALFLVKRVSKYANCLMLVGLRYSIRHFRDIIAWQKQWLLTQITIPEAYFVVHEYNTQAYWWKTRVRCRTSIRTIEEPSPSSRNACAFLFFVNSLSFSREAHLQNFDYVAFLRSFVQMSIIERGILQSAPSEGRWYVACASLADTPPECCRMSP